MNRREIYAAEKVPVEYIGRKEPWVDKLYGSKLPFNKGQVRVVPSDLAIRFLRHPDLFKLAEADTTGDEQKQGDNQSQDGQNAGQDAGQQGDKQEGQQQGDNGNGENGDSDKGDESSEGDQGEKSDDTDQRLAEAKAAEEAQRKEDQERQDLVDQVNAMTEKDQLEEFAQTKYQQRINKRKSIENLREDVVGMVNQFGVV